MGVANEQGGASAILQFRGRETRIIVKCLRSRSVSRSWTRRADEASSSSRMGSGSPPTEPSNSAQTSSTRYASLSSRQWLLCGELPSLTHATSILYRARSPFIVCLFLEAQCRDYVTEGVFRSLVGNEVFASVFMPFCGQKCVLYNTRWLFYSV